MLDYIIVGSGLAGICFAETALRNGKTFMVISDDSQNSSKVAAGLYNPVVLKRFNAVWNAQQQLDLSASFYSSLEQKLNIEVDYKIPIYRKIFSVEEQNNWFVASDKKDCTLFLNPNLVHQQYQYVAAPFGFGEVLQTGYVDTKNLLAAYHNYLMEGNCLLQETFDYAALEQREYIIQYKNWKSKHIVFAEGFGALSNPFFSKLPLEGVKGEIIIIKAPQLNLDVIIKTSLFIVPMGNDLFKVGATYNWEDKTSVPTKEGLEELLTELRQMISCDFEVVSQHAGVRPSVIDRRPLLGTHPKFSNVHILNGLGTRGVMLGPTMANVLFDYIENKTPLDKTIDIARFKKINW